MSHDVYQNPLVGRYASTFMQKLWSPQSVHSTWRRLWVALAESEKELGLPISDEALAQLRANVDNIDFAAAANYERSFRHDVMAHLHAYGDCAPAARGVIHLGATSCYVTDNTDLLLIRCALEYLRDGLVAAICSLADFAVRYRDLPCLAYTHLQPAQPTTVGKRATLWCQDLVLDLEEVEHRLATWRFRGVKGTTGTQASFLELFNGNQKQVEELDRRVASRMKADRLYPVTGQTYPRKFDAQVLACLSGIAQSAHKAATDWRLLHNFKELEEPFEEQQIGSSAMAYKRNPMRSERICALARFVTSLSSSAEQTASVQWMERTLDDSANRRLVIPQAFLAIDAILILYRNVVSGLTVYSHTVAKRLAAELPFMATEAILMAAVAAGGDRQELHERIRVHSNAAAQRVKQEGADNDLLERLRNDAAFRTVDWGDVMNPSRFVGRAPEQVDQFIRNVVDPIRERWGAGSERPTEAPRV